MKKDKFSEEPNDPVKHLTSMLEDTGILDNICPKGTITLKLRRGSYRWLTWLTSAGCWEVVLASKPRGIASLRRLEANSPSQRGRRIDGSRQERDEGAR